MALTTVYTIVPFQRGDSGKLQPAAPRHEFTHATAVATARGLVPHYAGVIVLIEQSDLAAGVFREPVLTFSAGEVPKDLTVVGLPL
jgi:hypothetical protein